MTLFYSLQRTFGKHIPENLTYYFLIGQIISYLLAYAYPQFRALFPLRGEWVYAGEWWRLFSFVLTPSSDNLIWVALAWYMFYFFGTGLEQRWGSFRYLVYLAVAYIGLILCAFVFPHQTITGSVLFLSIFFSFAYLYPEVQLMLFFIIPVKVKWMAVFGWLLIIGALLTQPFPYKVLMMVSVSNFFLFFGNDLLTRFRHTAPLARQQHREKKSTMNVCAVCGKNDIEDRQLDFRFCMDCNPPTCYCGEHLENHLHKKTRLVH